MLVGHASDLHGEFSALYANKRKPDIWVLTGDMLPNMMRPIVPNNERAFQSRFMMDQGPRLKRVFGSTPVVCVDGNHDFLSLYLALSVHGIDAYEVSTKPTLSLQGLTFAGFRDIRQIVGEWNYESDDATLQGLVDEVFQDPPDVLVTHAPPNGVLDQGRNEYNALEHWGIPALTNALGFRPHKIRAHLFGHVHEARGEVTINGTLYSNAATTLRFIEL